MMTIILTYKEALRKSTVIDIHISASLTPIEKTPSSRIFAAETCGVVVFRYVIADSEDENYSTYYP
jgi:hypothetical protein